MNQVTVTHEGKNLQMDVLTSVGRCPEFIMLVFEDKPYIKEFDVFRVVEVDEKGIPVEIEPFVRCSMKPHGGCHMAFADNGHIFIRSIQDYHSVRKLFQALESMAEKMRKA